MADKPRLLVIEREPGTEAQPRWDLLESYEVVRVRTMARALACLREGPFAGVYVDASQLPAVRWAGTMLQADEILEAISDGVTVVDPDLRIIWANPEFLRLAVPELDPAGAKFYKLLGSPENCGQDPCPFTSALSSRAPAGTVLRMGANRYIRVTVTPVFDTAGNPTHLIALTRDVTAQAFQEQKLDAIHKAGEELADLTPEDLAEMTLDDRTSLLKYNISRHMKDLLGLDYIEIRLLDRESGRLIPLLTEGMTPLAANRQLYARNEGQGVTGFVAVTGQSYLCPDTARDPLYIEGAEGARSSLTIPLLYHGTVIGTLNVENPRPNAFDERDRQLLEIYARSVASALNTLELLHAEKRFVANASVEAIRRELALPLDEILSDATAALDRYLGEDTQLVERLNNLLSRARDIRGLIQKVGTKIVPPDSSRELERTPPRLENALVLVVDADESVRRAAHSLLGREGGIVETAQSGAEAIALARRAPYTVALADIRLPDMEGFEIYSRLRGVHPGMPVVLMTGFGYDPTHAIVKARQDGLQTVLYKPFRTDRLIEAVEQALRTSSSDLDGRNAALPPAVTADGSPTSPSVSEPEADTRTGIGTGTDTE